MRTVLMLLLLVALAATLPATPAQADPCGMVPPPIQVQGGPAIERIGAQKTYVFHRNGIETFVIRPGFRGRVDNFGMLIPFPTPPAIRKVDDSIFTHIANAIDPPEVVVDVDWYRRIEEMQNMAADDGAAGGGEGGLGENEIRVLNEEGVGMYQVAVLEAGSANALKRWMDDNGYVYPEGMDRPCQDYVDAGWCFVTVKTRLAGKSTVDPQAGQREVPNPSGEFAFDGNVQAMGFRFRSEELVVPMRLSAFNEGELHNVVYILAEGPRKIVGIPEEYVRRQLSGEELYRNLTSPLPLRVLNGTWDDVPDHARPGIEAQRDAEPHLGLARELFLWDIHTSETGQLLHGHELKEKQFLDISERLGLRGPEIDQVHRAELQANHIPSEPAEDTLELLQGMTLTVVDGDFQREVLANDNLTFASFEMPGTRNHPRHYNAARGGPFWRDDGTRYQQETPPSGSATWIVALFVALAVGASVASYIMIRAMRRDADARNPYRGPAPANPDATTGTPTGSDSSTNQPGDAPADS